MYNLDEAIVSYASRYNGLTELQKEGVSEEDFVDDFRAVWRFLVRAKNEHDAVPSPEVLRQRFPDIEIPSVKKRDLAILLRQLRDRKKYRLFLSALHEAASNTVDFENVDDAVQSLQAKLGGLSLTGGKNTHLVDLFSDEATELMLAEIADIRSGRRMGIPSGFPKFDSMAGGLRKQKMYVIIGRSGLGKASAVSEPVLTPGGWERMGALSPGDLVTTADGSVVPILSVHPQGVVPIFRVSFSDGTSTKVTEDHLWKVGIRGNWSVRTTGELARRLKETKERHYIPLVQPYGGSDEGQPLAPYLLGALLGDGCLSVDGEIGFSNIAEEVWDRCSVLLPDSVEFNRYPKGNAGQIRWKTPYHRGGMNWQGPNPVVQAIRELGLSGTTSHTKFIPEQYLWGSADARLELLRGLMDTDGYISPGSTLEFSSKSRKLTLGVQHLVESLGGTARIHSKDCGAYPEAWCLYIKMPSATNPFHLARKAERFGFQHNEPYRRIEAIEYLWEEEAQCIVVDHPDHLYVTSNHIVTHNSWIDLYFAANAVINGYKVILYPLEMNLFDTAARLYTIFSQITGGQANVLRNHDITSGRVTAAKVQRFLGVLEDRYKGQLYVADVGLMSDPYTIERIDAETELYKPDMNWVDYITLLKAPVGVARSDDWQAVRALSHGIHDIALRRNIVGGCSAQVSREAMRVNTFLPRLEHIAYGDSIGQDADGVFSINRRREYLYWALVKHRGGPEISKTKVLWQPNDGLFTEQADEVGDED